VDDPATKIIRVSSETKKALDELKTHHRETYDDVIRRLIEQWRRSTSSK
jgi:predicted CopG family antitoxin